MGRRVKGGEGEGEGEGGEKGGREEERGVVCVYVHWKRRSVEVYCSDFRLGEAVSAELANL